jgi:hypothetical protein
VNFPEGESLQKGNWDSPGREIFMDIESRHVIKFEVIKEFPDRIAETLDECIEQLSKAISDLANSADSVIESMTDGDAS